MSETKINWQRPIQTRDGRKAECTAILCTSSGIRRLIVTDEKVASDGRTWGTYFSVTAEGEFIRCGTSHNDIINVPEFETVEITWDQHVRLYQNSNGRKFIVVDAPVSALLDVTFVGCVKIESPTSIKVLKQ